MKRTLSLVLALVMVLGTFTSVFAEPVNAEVEAAGELLEELGVLKGSLAGDLGLENALKREDAVVMLSRLMGEEGLAKDFPGVEEILTYEDLEEADPFYLPYLAWAYTNKTFEGHSPVRFGYGEAMTGKEYLNVLLKVLGYDDVAWEDVMDKAVEVGLVEDAEEGEFVRGTMAVMTKVALETKMNGSEVTLAESLDIEMPAPPAPEALEVEEVVADNLKEVKVVFNQEVDKDTVTDSNVAVKGLDGSVKLLEDGVTAIITVNKVLVNQGKYKVVVDKVATAEEVVIEKAEVEFTAFDATLPVVEEVIVTGPRNLTLVFSEPMNAEKVGKVEVKQDKLTLGNSVKVSGNKVDVQVFTNFADGKEYTVTVRDFEDYAGYKNVINTLAFTYEKDETPPIATVEKVEQEYVVVSFSKPVKGIDKSKFYHTFSAWKAVSVKNAAGDDIGANDSVNQVFVYFYENDGDKGIPAGGTVLGILGNTIKDNWGNALGNQEFEITAVADRVAPEVDSIAVRAEDTLRVTFTKAVKPLARKNVEILDEAGKAISGMYVNITPVKANVYDIVMSKAQAGKVLTVSIKDVEDTTLFGNVLSLHTELVEVTDKTAPGVSKVYYSFEGPEKDGDVYNKSREIYVVYDEAVDAETALVASNYSLVKGGKVFILSADPTFDALNNRVKLPLTKAEANAHGADIMVKGKVALQIINVKDLAGNAIVPEQHAFDGDVAETSNVEVKSVVATNKTTIVVKFGDLLSDVTTEAFLVNGEDKFTLSQADTATSTTLTFEVAKEKAFATNPEDVTFEILPDKKIKNSYGNEAKFSEGEMNVTDGIAPEIDEVLVDGDKVTIVFSEAMAEDTFSRYSFLVDGYKVAADGFAIDGDTLVLTLNEDYDTDNKVIMITYNLDVTDLAGNKLDVDKGVNEEYDYDPVDEDDDPVVDEVDKADLEAKIEEVEELVEENYTEETWGLFATALAEAKTVANDDEATQEDVDTALEDLKNAKEALEEVEEEEDPVVEEATVEATFTVVAGAAGQIMGYVTITHENLDEDVAKYAVTHKSGTTPIVNIDEQTANFPLPKEGEEVLPVTITIYAEDGVTVVHKFENLELTVEL